MASAREMLAAVTGGRSLRGLRVLDIGCRTGESVAALVEEGADAWGLDIGPACIAGARQRYPQLADRFSCVDMRDLDASPHGDFDLVTCVGALPYLHPDEWLPVVRAMVRRCQKEGEVVVVFQRPRSKLAGVAVRALSRLPEPAFYHLAAPVLAAAMFPVSRWLLHRPAAWADLHYGVAVSLYGLSFGFPDALRAYEIAFPPCRFLSPATSAVFAIPAYARL